MGSLSAARVRCALSAWPRSRGSSGGAPDPHPPHNPTYPCPYLAAITSLEFMSMVRVHPEVPLNSNGAGLGPRR
jgi:hypothetical protein